MLATGTQHLVLLGSVVHLSLLDPLPVYGNFAAVDLSSDNGNLALVQDHYVRNDRDRCEHFQCF